MTFVMSVVLAAALVTQTGPVTAQRQLTPEKALRLEVTVPGAIDAVWQAFTTEAAGSGATRVALVQTGWQASDEWDAAYDYLATGIAQLLAQLHRRFTSGPIAWPASR